MDLLQKDSSALIVLPLLALMEHITSARLYAGTGRVDASQVSMHFMAFSSCFLQRLFLSLSLDFAGNDLNWDIKHFGKFSK